MSPHDAPARSAEAVLEHVLDGHDLIVPTANGEPVTLLDAVESAAAAEEIDDVRVHQVFPLRERPHHAGAYGDRLRHVSYFLGATLRPHYEAGTIDLVPNDLGQIPSILRTLDDPLMIVSASPPDANGFVSLGANANYAAALYGEVRLFVEVNARMPRTSGRNQIHLSNAAAWVEADYESVAAPPAQISDKDRAIAAFVADASRNGPACRSGSALSPRRWPVCSWTGVASVCTPSCSPMASECSSRPARSTGPTRAEVVTRRSPPTRWAPRSSTSSWTTTAMSCSGRSRRPMILG
jgi:hypothetical protein